MINAMLPCFQPSSEHKRFYSFKSLKAAKWGSWRNHILIGFFGFKKQTDGRGYLTLSSLGLFWIFFTTLHFVWKTVSCGNAWKCFFNKSKTSLIYIYFWINLHNNSTITHETVYQTATILNVSPFFTAINHK